MIVHRKKDGKTHVVSEPEDMNKTLCGLDAGSGIYSSRGRTNCESCYLISQRMSKIKYDEDIEDYEFIKKQFDKRVLEINKLRKDKRLLS